MFQTAFQANAFQVNAFQIGTGPTPVPEMDMHDGITKEELKRIRALLKKRQQAENERNRLRIEKIRARKEALTNLIDPKEVRKVIEVKVKSIQPKIEKVDFDIQSLENERQNLIHAIQVRQEIYTLNMQLAIQNAKTRADQDDEEAILILLH
jgi:vacuolar-type H+-ATPase subunit I/STV1